MPGAGLDPVFLTRALRALMVSVVPCRVRRVVGSGAERDPEGPKPLSELPLADAVTSYLAFLEEQHRDLPEVAPSGFWIGLADVAFLQRGLELRKDTVENRVHLVAEVAVGLSQKGEDDHSLAQRFCAVGAGRFL